MGYFYSFAARAALDVWSVRCIVCLDSGCGRAQVLCPSGALFQALDARALVLPSPLAQRLYRRGRTNPGAMRPELSGTRLRTCCQLLALL